MKGVLLSRSARGLGRSEDLFWNRTGFKRLCAPPPTSPQIRGTRENRVVEGLLHDIHLLSAEGDAEAGSINSRNGYQQSRVLGLGLGIS